ncbi:MAG: helix-turn-helix transcriptional regulator [Thermomicrobiales bacterium]|nr:helix-turn-helix transcriptional regulator [Thermomicrobiales bacterium]
MRQSDLAADLGQPQSFVSKFESGERRLTVGELVIVCSALGIDICDVITSSEMKQIESESTVSSPTGVLLGKRSLPERKTGVHSSGRQDNKDSHN